MTTVVIDIPESQAKTCRFARHSVYDLLSLLLVPRVNNKREYLTLVWVIKNDIHKSFWIL